MKIIKVEKIERMYRNAGQHAEQALAYTLTHEIRLCDNKRFDIDSDISEYGISVKSSHFSLASANSFNTHTRDEQILEYAERTHSTTVAYVTKDFSKAYLMSIDEFIDFLIEFSYLDYNVNKKTKEKMYKTRCRAESKKMIAYLDSKLN